METTSGEEVFAFIAAAAAGTGNDDHQKEKGVQETIEPATKKQRNHHGITSHGSRSIQERVGTIDTTLAEHTQQLRALFKRNFGQSVTS